MDPWRVFGLWTLLNGMQSFVCVCTFMWGESLLFRILEGFVSLTLLSSPQSLLMHMQKPIRIIDLGHFRTFVLCGHSLLPAAWLPLSPFSRTYHQPQCGSVSLVWGKYFRYPPGRVRAGILPRLLPCLVILAKLFRTLARAVWCGKVEAGRMRSIARQS